jgi:hypothetical protein
VAVRDYHRAGLRLGRLGKTRAVASHLHTAVKKHRGFAKLRAHAAAADLARAAQKGDFQTQSTNMEKIRWNKNVARAPTPLLAQFFIA